MKQTAVEWLTEKLRTEFGFTFSENILEQAKEMEKQQIIDANFSSRAENGISPSEANLFYDLSEQYYKETYGK